MNTNQGKAGAGPEDARGIQRPGRTSPFTVRAGQREFERGVQAHRIAGLVARRQYGKTTIASRIALKKMMKTPGHTVIFGSVKLDLGREIVRKESEAIHRAITWMTAQAQEAGTRLDVVDQQGGKSLGTVGADDFAEVYEASRLEFRLHHSRTVYSRTKVVALTAAAVGETGDLILDEVGRVRDFKGVWEAVKPIIASQPTFRCILTTTPPPDDAHYSFELLSPPIGAELGVRPTGNWYQSDLGVWVLRITAYDAYADGIPLYDDDTGAPQSPDEARRRDADKDAWDRNYGCKFVLGGTAACGVIQLDTAQRRGVEACRLIQVQDEGDMADGLAWLAGHLGAGKIGLGWDLATTTSETSNPSALAVLERQGVDAVLRAVFVWKTADPDVALARVRAVVETIAARREGGRARRLCVDATNERYFAQRVRKEFARLLPVDLVIGSETIELPGQPEPLTMKQYLGGRLVAELDDNRLWLPPERYLKDDWRLERKEKGLFVCDPDADGKHGDTFDAAKLALEALSSTRGAIESVAGIRTAVDPAGVPRSRPTFHPRRLA